MPRTDRTHPSRLALLLVVLAGLSARPREVTAAPLGVRIECEEEGRTKACPAFLLGFIDAHPVLRAAPRATAEIVVYAAATEVALVDRMHLRFVGRVPGAPHVVEIDVDLDTRATDDAQRAQLQPAFLRGLALFVGARYPEAVTVTFAAPAADLAKRPRDTSPWDVSLSLGSSGSRTERFRSYSGYAELGVSRLTRRTRVEALVSAWGNVNQQPPLTLDDGTEVSLDQRQWNTGAMLRGARLLDDRWSLGAVARVARDDPNGQFAYATSARGGVEWDRYAADDPRGNRLSLMYFAGHQVERYHLRNELRETFAQYPVHGFIASGTLRQDRVGIGVSVTATSQVLRPQRRHSVSASPFLQVQLGGHVDLDVSFSITKRALPLPDESQIDPLDFQQLSRLAYAEPLSLNGSISVTFHWDRTNGARNDRFTDL